MAQHATAIQLTPSQTRARAKNPAVSMHRHVRVDTILTVRNTAIVRFSPEAGCLRQLKTGQLCPDVHPTPSSGRAST